MSSVRSVTYVAGRPGALQFSVHQAGGWPEFYAQAGELLRQAEVEAERQSAAALNAVNSQKWRPDRLSRLECRKACHP